jgi:hypothetical protein
LLGLLHNCGMSAALPSLLTPQDVGLWLSIPTGRVVRLARRGDLPCVTLPDGELLFESAELARWLEGLRKREGVRCGD